MKPLLILLILLLPAPLSGQPSPGPVCTIRDLVEYPAEMREMWEVRQAKRYHGTLTAFRDGDEWYFERDGQKCKLFTEGYLEHKKDK